MYSLRHERRKELWIARVVYEGFRVVVTSEVGLSK